jgi:hypothetical protein
MAPRSPHVILGGYKILSRTIDKCRAAINGTIGEYHFDCPLDNQLFSFKGIKGDDFKKFVASGASDEEIVEWVSKNGTLRTAAEIEEWNGKVSSNNYSDNADKAAWLAGEVSKAGLPKGTTLFDWLDADDTTSFA